MNDVVRSVVLAPGDEYLLAEQAIGAVIAPLGPALQRADVRPCMRLGEVHGGSPLAGDELRQVFVLKFRAAVGAQRLDRTHRQRRAEREGCGAGIPHFKSGDVQHVRQALAAIFLGACQSVPATCDPVLIEFRPAIRGLHFAVNQTSALPVADLGQRGDFFRRETTGFVQDRIDEILAEVTEQAFIDRVAQPCDMSQSKRDVLDGRLVHIISSHLKRNRGSKPPMEELIDFYVNVNFEFGVSESTTSCRSQVFTLAQTTVMENL